MRCVKMSSNNLFWEGPDLLPRPIHGTSRAETRHRLLTKSFTGADEFWDPGVPCAKFSSNQFRFKSPRKLVKIPQLGPPTTCCWCSIHQHTSPAADAASGALGCVPAAKFMVDHASRIKFLISMDYGLYNFSVVKCNDARKFAWTRFRNAIRVGLDCLRGMERTVQVLATHCVSKQSSDIVASPGTTLAPALNRQGTAATAHPHACCSKGCSSTASCTLLQHLWGSKAQPQRDTCTHTHARTHIHTPTRMRMRTHIQAQTRARIHTGAHTHTHAHAQIHACAHI